MREKISTNKDDASAACNDYLKVFGYISLSFAWLKIMKKSFEKIDQNKKFYEDKIIILNAYNLSPSPDGSIKFYHKGKFVGNFRIVDKYENCYFIERKDDWDI